MVTDPYKDLTIGYDVLNKTDKITMSYYTNRFIYYIYDANGSVLEKQEWNNGSETKTDYLDGFVYINGALNYITVPEGRVLYNGTSFTNEYIITDQQGNARVSFNNTGTGGTAAIVQENSYYGYGMVMPGSNISGGTNKLLYNGKSEWQNDYSIMPDYYQTGARNYDPEIGRFIAQDAMADASANMSTYHYAGDDPVMFNDPTGNLIDPSKTAKQPLPITGVDMLGQDSAFLQSIGQEDTSDADVAAFYGDVAGATGGGAFIGPPALNDGSNLGGASVSGGMVISNPAAIADIFHAVQSGNDVLLSLSPGGTYSVSYYYDVQGASNNVAAIGGLIAWGSYQNGPAGACATPLSNIANQVGSVVGSAAASPPSSPPIFGLTNTKQTGTTTPFFVTNIGDRVRLKTYTIQSKEKAGLFNANSTVYTDQYGNPEVSGDISMQGTMPGTIRLTSDGYLEFDIGPDGTTLNIGISPEGFTIGGESVGPRGNGSGFQFEGHFGLGTGLIGAGVFMFGPAFIPQVAPLLQSK